MFQFNQEPSKKLFSNEYIKFIIDGIDRNKATPLVGTIHPFRKKFLFSYIESKSFKASSIVDNLGGPPKSYSSHGNYTIFYFYVEGSFLP